MRLFMKGGPLRLIGRSGAGTLTLLCLMLFVTTIFGPSIHAKVKNADRLIAMPTRDLLNVGRSYLHDKFLPDSALEVYSIVTSRYTPKMSLSEKKEIVEAYNGLWETYMFGYYDSTEASRVLYRSSEICEEAGLPAGRNYFNMGIMYQNMAEMSGNSEILYKDAAENYKQAFKAADKEGDAKLILAVGVSLADIARSLDDPSLVAEEVGTLRRRARDLKLDGSWRFPFILTFHEALDALSRKDFKEAIYAYGRMQLTIPKGDDPELIRHRVYALLCIADTEALDGRMEEASRLRREALEICRKFDFKDGMLQCLDVLATQYENIDKETFIDYRNRHLLLKDSLLNYRQMASVKEMKIHHQMKDLDRQIADMKRTEERQMLVLVIVLTVVAATVMMLLIIYTKNRKLKALNQTLYSKNLEYLKAEEQRSIKQKEPPISDKYKNSQLDKENKDHILMKIREVMEESEEIFQPGFSAANLSELTGFNYKYLSQVINETYGCNFNVFLNEFRVKRACLLINSMAKTMPLTIEGLAYQVGFRSRNSFAVAFKKFTGLNPSEYIRAARLSKD